MTNSLRVRSVFSLPRQSLTCPNSSWSYSSLDGTHREDQVEVGADYPASSCSPFSFVLLPSVSRKSLLCPTSVSLPLGKVLVSEPKFAPDRLSRVDSSPRSLDPFAFSVSFQKKPHDGSAQPPPPVPRRYRAAQAYVRTLHTPGHWLLKK